MSKKTVELIFPEDVVEQFEVFLRSYDGFRECNGLKNKVKNIHEICNAMTDKHGRICRYIKHWERKDPKSDWPKGMTMAMSGYVAYMIMILKHYKIDIRDGMIEELNEAIRQHKK